jgi:hypothetical protein
LFIHPVKNVVIHSAVSRYRIALWNFGLPFGFALESCKHFFSWLIDYLSCCVFYYSKLFKYFDFDLTVTFGIWNCHSWKERVWRQFLFMNELWGWLNHQIFINHLELIWLLISIECLINQHYTDFFQYFS